MTSYRQDVKRAPAPQLGGGRARRARRGGGTAGTAGLVNVIIVVVVVVVELDGAAAGVAAVVSSAQEQAQHHGAERGQHHARKLLYLLFDYLEHTPPLASPAATTYNTRQFAERGTRAVHR